MPDTKPPADAPPARSADETAPKVVESQKGGKVDYSSVPQLDLIRRVSALQGVLDAHKIDTSALTQSVIDAIPVTDGVAAPFKYEAPRPAPKPVPKTHKLGGEQSGALTKEDLKTLSESEINRRWDEVSRLL